MFVLSITPTKFLHQVFANHSDFVTVSLNDTHSTQFNVSGINCHCDHLVVISPFISGNCVSPKEALQVFQKLNICKTFQIPFSKSFTFKLRGPPIDV